MKKILFIVIMSVLWTDSYSQILFEKGYFINDSNQRVECLIKNIDWKNNPTKFEYKLYENDKIQKATILNIKEFGINDVSKYIRAQTKIDSSSDLIDRMSSEKNPQFKDKLVFLKVLIEGQASLFQYTNDYSTKFFYKLNDTEIIQLVYKRYLIDDEIFVNDQFKQQLIENFNCKEIQLNHVQNLKYNRQELERIFILFNQCIRSNYIYLKSKTKKDHFKLTIRPGLNYSNLKIRSTQLSFGDTDFENTFGIRFGIETEFNLQFNKRKWSIIFEPTYQYFKSKQSKESSIFIDRIVLTKVDYKSIELPLGVRHYLYLNKNSKFFLNISYVLDFAINSTIKFCRSDESLIADLDISSRGNVNLGFGFKYKNRYGIEFQYRTNREILGDHPNWSSNYKSLNLILGISIL